MSQVGSGRLIGLPSVLHFAGAVSAPAADDSEEFVTEAIVAVTELDPDSRVRLALVYLENFPLDSSPRYRVRSKTIFHSPATGHGPGDDNPRAVCAGDNDLIYKPARSVWGYGSGPVSEIGAIGPEVTFASGIDCGQRLIEEPIKIH